MSYPAPLGQTPAKSPDPCDQLLLNDTLLSRLAHELARGIYPPAEVLATYQISEDTFNDRVMNNPSFMAYYAEAYAIWHESTNAPERIRLKSGTMFEDWLREADRLLHDPTSPMAPKVELAKYLSRISGIEPVATQTAGSDRGVSVTINLGHARISPKTITIEKAITDVPADLPDGVSQ